MTALEIAGRPARVAMLVYNDAHNDARVLKEASALRDAGADVRIVAVARNLAGYPAGVAHLPNGVVIERVQEFSLAQVAPALAPLSRRLTRAAADPPASPAAAPGTPIAPPTAAASRPAAQAATRRPARGGSLARRPIALAKDLADRAFRTIALGAYWVRATRAATAWHPDVVHANDGNTLAPALAIARAARARIVYDSHELWRFRNVRSDRPLAPFVEGAIERVGIRRAAGVVTVSGSIVHDLQRRYRLRTEPTLVRNIPSASAVPPVSAGRLHELAGLSSSQRVIAYGGRITTSRGIEETIDALSLLPGEVHLVMLGYGEPDYLRALTARAERRGTADRVHVVGPVSPSEVTPALADADVSVVHVRPTCLSYRYSLPNKLFESIRAGLPVVAADLPDIRAVVEATGAGVLFEGAEVGPDSPGAHDAAADLAATIARVLADPAPYRAAARRASAGLRWEDEAARLITLYSRILAGGSSEPA